MNGGKNMCECCGSQQKEVHARTKMLVRELTGEGCATVIETSLLHLPGVHHVHIHAHAGEIFVDYNPLQISLQDISRELKVLGFTAAV